MASFTDGGKTVHAGGTIGAAIAKHRLLHGAPKEEKEEKDGDKHAKVGEHLAKAQEHLTAAKDLHEGGAASEEHGEKPLEEDGEAGDGAGFMKSLAAE